MDSRLRYIETLGSLENKNITVEEAQRLKPMLEERWRRALIEGPRHLADDLLFTLIGLYAYINGSTLSKYSMASEYLPRSARALPLFIRALMLSGSTDNSLS